MNDILTPVMLFFNYDGGCYFLFHESFQIQVNYPLTIVLNTGGDGLVFKVNLTLKLKGLNCKGFTMVELLADIVIIGVLAAIAVPSVVRLIDKTKTDVCQSIEYY